MSLPPPDFAGFLEKLGGKLVARNQTRYFELRGPNLYYYKQKPASPSDQPIGAIDLVDTKISDYPKEKFSWTIGGPKLRKEYVLCAANEQEKNAWTQVLSNPKKSTNAPQLSTTGGDDEEDAGEQPKMFYAAGGKKVSTDDFEIVRVIGKGSFGKVMEVRKKDTGETFAMKEMSKEAIERENLVEHIFAEKSILQKIDHPFIVQLHYAFQTKDKLYLVLDFLSGGELFFHLSNDRKFDEWRAKFYTAEIGLALGHLHSFNIIYRDLKPENAVLDKEGHVCITDFGLAKTNVQSTKAAFTFCGTPEYLAPEHLIGEGHGKAVDWWSLGILLYEMLCGIPPFYSESVTIMYDLILKAPLEFPEDVSPAARDLCSKLLDRNSETRMQDIESLRKHPFFSDLSFDDLYARKIPPPFKPEADAEKNFDTEFTSLNPRLSVGHGNGAGGQGHVQVPGFTFEGRASDLQK